MGIVIAADDPLVVLNRYVEWVRSAFTGKIPDYRKVELKADLDAGMRQAGADAQQRVDAQAELTAVLAAQDAAAEVSGINIGKILQQAAAVATVGFVAWAVLKSK
jgi:hypothetical protein